MSLVVPRHFFAVLVVFLGCWLTAAISPARAADDEGQAPPWAKQPLPPWIKPSFLGKHGLPEPWCSRPGPLALPVGGIDRWQANHFIVYRPETAKFLYSKYTPTKVEYHKGLFPALEKIVAQYTRPGQSDGEKAMALLTQAMPEHLLHPEVPPLGPRVATNRAMSDEALWASGCGWCNEQTRVYIRLCQIAGVPARMIYLFFSDGKMGHVVTEFYADGHWCMADSSWICVFPDEHGRLLSAAELHVPAALPLVARTYMARWKQILQQSKDPADRALATQGEEAIRKKKEFGPSKADQFGCFGVLNYPLPPSRAALLGVHAAAPKAKPGPAKAKAADNPPVIVEVAAAGRYRFNTEVQLSAMTTPLLIRFLTPEPQNPKTPAAGEVVLRCEAEGKAMTVGLRDPAAGNKGNLGILRYTYWPGNPPARRGAAAGENKAEKGLLRAGLKPRSATDHGISIAIDVDGKTAAVWIEGRFVGNFNIPAEAHGAIVVQPAAGEKVRHAEVAQLGDPGLLPIKLDAYANDRFSAPLDPQAGAPSQIKASGIEFQLLRGPQNQVNLRPAQWTEWKTDGTPWAGENYDSGSPIAFDPRMPMLRVPAVDYIAAHVLAVAEDDPKLTSTLTLRAGRSAGGNSLAIQYDFAAAVPRRSQLDSLPADQVVTTPAGRLAHVVLPIGRAISQDLHLPGPHDGDPRDAMDMELTKEIRLTIRAPEANRFRYRPLGPSSGVRIAALTLEKAPLQMRVSSSEAGNAFVEPQKPAFQVQLRNITDKTQPYTLIARARHLDGTPVSVRTAGSVAAGQTAEVALELPVPKRGYYDVDVAVVDAARRELVRRTSFALLPPDTRKHRDQSPFGTYDFGGAHFTPYKADLCGSLYVKAGLRYGMFGFPAADLDKYGILRGDEPNIMGSPQWRLSGTACWRKALEVTPNVPPLALVFHEMTISGDHCTRVPDLFTDRTYKLNEEEQRTFDKDWENALTITRAMRKEFPEVKLALGNGPLPTKEEFYRHHFPAELFDSGGNESGAYNRPPESQPPDWIAHNASLWMDRQMLDAYGYKDKPVTQCHEICYPDTNPGNLTLRTQADYFIRHAMHSLAWGIPQIRMGLICDVGGSYYYGNWGGSGLCNFFPELNVKPSFVAMATMTRVLDGAKFRKVLDLGSASLYGVAFDRPDGRQALVLWTTRGHRPVRLKFKTTAAGEYQLVDDQSNETSLAASDDTLEITLSPTPVYLLTRDELAGAKAGTPRYDERPAGKATVINDLASLSDWKLEKTPNMLLEYYNFLEPRQQGDFTFEPAAEFEGRKNVLQVTPRPIGAPGTLGRGKDTMPMYAVLAHDKGIPLPGTPTEIGVWVNGNSSWGRVIYELQDASGQRWISIGNRAAGAPADYGAEGPSAGGLRVSAQKAPVDEWCDNDSFGWSRFDFDGWRYVAFPAPGQYPGEGCHWPHNVQWYHDKDGVVHYPLVFKKLIVQLPTKTLHVRDFLPPPRPEVYLKDLTVGQVDTRTYLIKTTSDCR